MSPIEKSARAALGDVPEYLYSYVPSAIKDKVLTEGLYSGEALLQRPDLLAASSAAFGEDPEAKAERIKARLRTWMKQSVRGPNAFFHEVPDAGKLPATHPLRQFDLSPVRIALRALLADLPKTRLHGSELVPNVPGAIGRYRFLKRRELAGFSNVPADELWGRYKDPEGKGYYAADVPHVAIHAPGGVVPAKYLAPDRAKGDNRWHVPEDTAIPYKSKSQARAFFAMEARNELPKGTARRWAHHTKDIKALPEKVKESFAKSAVNIGKLLGWLGGRLSPLGATGKPLGQAVANMAMAPVKAVGRAASAAKAHPYKATALGLGTVGAGYGAVQSGLAGKAFDALPQDWRSSPQLPEFMRASPVAAAPAAAPAAAASPVAASPVAAVAGKSMDSSEPAAPAAAPSGGEEGAGGDYRHLLPIGIGGGALAAAALYKALRNRRRDKKSFDLGCFLASAR